MILNLCVDGPRVQYDVHNKIATCTYFIDFMCKYDIHIFIKQYIQKPMFISYYIDSVFRWNAMILIHDYMMTEV